MKTTSTLLRQAHLARRAFTLIELLVVIAIIAVLSSLALPAMQNALIESHVARATQNAKQIGLGLRMFANDHDGNFPDDKNSYGEAIKSSNDAFRGLIPSYLDNEQVFAVGRSKVGPKADNKLEPANEILRPGENHFAYIAGLSSTSPSTWPLIVDSTDGSGKYTEQEGGPGGTWKGRKAIVINVDTSAQAVPLMGKGASRYLPRVGDPAQDALELSYMGGVARLLEPTSR